MARAAVKAKQAQARAQAQPVKARARGRRKHASGGNPNQQLFFMRLRRGGKWMYAILAIVFAAAFAGVGVGSGSGGLSDLWTGLFGSGGNPVQAAQKEIATNPAKGYKDLAQAYETKGDTASAITALQSYVGLPKGKKDAAAWTQLAGLQLSQAQTYSSQYQAAQQAAQAANPSQPFVPSSGQLAGAFGGKATAASTQQSSAQLSLLYQQASAASAAEVHDYQQAAKLQPKNAQAQFTLAQGAQQAGQYSVALTAYQRYLQLDPRTPQRAQIESLIKQLQGIVSPPAPKKK